MIDLVLNPEIKITDMITSISVICAASTLIYTWTKDRRLRTREYADRIRAAATLTLSKVDRYQALLLSIGRLLQSRITDADELIVRTQDPVRCRDEFWKSLHIVRADILNTIQNEDIESSYAPLYAFRQDIYNRFRQTLHMATALENSSFWRLQSRCQDLILSMPKQSLSSALTGNELRYIVASHEEEYSIFLSETFDELRGFLRKAVSEPDDRLVSPRLDATSIEDGCSSPRPEWDLRWGNGPAGERARMASSQTAKSDEEWALVNDCR